MSTDPQQGFAELALERMAEKIRGTGYGFSDIEWRDQMIRELREALKFYADTKNYHGFDTGVLVDNGKIAREALKQ